MMMNELGLFMQAGAELLSRVLGCKSKSYSDIQEVSGTVFLLRIFGA